MTLISRLESATGPDRALADEVLLACGWTILNPNDAFNYWLTPTKSVVNRYIDPLASIDDAMTLVPEGWCWQVGPFHIDMISRAQIAEPLADVGGYGPGVGVRAQANHKIPAIALCIAALKARQEGV